MSLRCPVEAQEDRADACEDRLRRPTISSVCGQMARIIGKGKRAQDVSRKSRQEVDEGMAGMWWIVCHPGQWLGE